ncbi:hepcidin-like [Nerophis lumbriciformis]|uniref:hepcidin-like n=1 Tax=Nerophis lumbriciformis TaxID=546530 RepID=UPI002AE01DB7|nr:hepcidin-like [Nerophis lumbriciformis]
MKTFSIAVAVIIALVLSLIQESYASSFSEEDDVAAARSGADVEHFEMTADKSKMNVSITQKLQHNARACRWCCNCCRQGPRWCGLCCEW